MLADIILGPVAGSRTGKLNEPDIAVAHLALGYTAWAAMATGTLAFVFQ
jgi:hypothetical protein